MEDTKLWWQSKTIWGSIVTSISLLLYLFGVGPMLGSEHITQITDIVLFLVGSSGVLTTIIGRYTATQKVVLTKPTEETTSS